MKTIALIMLSLFLQSCKSTNTEPAPWDQMDETYSM